MALYGHVPMMIGHSAAHTGGIFWFNSAETYIDVTKSESSVCSPVHPLPPRHPTVFCRGVAASSAPPS